MRFRAAGPPICSLRLKAPLTAVQATWISSSMALNTARAWVLPIWRPEAPAQSEISPPSHTIRICAASSSKPSSGEYANSSELQAMRESHGVVVLATTRGRVLSRARKRRERYVVWML